MGVGLVDVSQAGELLLSLPQHLEPFTEVHAGTSRVLGTQLCFTFGV